MKNKIAIIGGDLRIAKLATMLAKDNNEIIELVDRLGENCTDEEFEVLRDIFVNCSRYEYMFWDMSYKKEM